jgi:hypothetical protein
MEMNSFLIIKTLYWILSPTEETIRDSPRILRHLLSYTKTTIVCACYAHGCHWPHPTYCNSTPKKAHRFHIIIIIIII